MSPNPFPSENESRPCMTHFPPPVPSDLLPPDPGRPFRAALFAPILLFVTLAAVVIGLSGHAVPVEYPADDAVRPGGVKRSEAEIRAFMERDVMPWATAALEPVVGRGNVTCETCHGKQAEARGYVMPAVTALPNADVRRWAETAGSDSQVRNALHGYLAQGDNLAIAAHMRLVVTPGMATLLRRPAYDFAQTYEYNRSRAAFGCYHCHMVGKPEAASSRQQNW
jgi:hypothetical protein